MISTDQANQIYRSFISAWLRDQIHQQAVRPGSVRATTATVLYADLSGFTRLCNAFTHIPDGAEQLHEALTRYFTAMIDTITAHGGDVAAIAGDALNAWWPDRNDVGLARRCGQAMLTVIESLPAIVTPKGRFRLELRIGISNGPLYAALTGVPSFGLHFALFGPVIDAATMAERVALPGQIHVAAPPPSPDPPRLPEPLIDHETNLSYEHFLPPTFAKRLRFSEQAAEYRRCVPAFANFDLPKDPSDLHRLVAQVQAVVERWGGWLNEVEIGDKGAVLVILFGAPTSRGDDSSRAVGCCLELRDRRLINRAGITLGILFVGAVGSPRRRVFTAQGDDMNLAAYLMQHAETGEIRVSGRVRQDILGRYQTSTPWMIRTKTQSVQIPVARVIATSHLTNHVGSSFQRYIPSTTAPVGRTTERALLAEAVSNAVSGSSQVVLLEGESGIGKSVLGYDLIARWIDLRLDAYSGECSSGGQAVPLLAWRPILIDIFGIDESTQPATQRRRLARALAGLTGATAHNRRLLAQLLGISATSSGSLPQLSSDEAAGLIKLIVAAITRALASRPLLIMLEDVHWADELSLATAAALAEQVPSGVCLCLALTCRPIEGQIPPALIRLRRAADRLYLCLRRLHTEAIGDLIRSLLGVTNVHPDLLRQIELHTEGQPLFVREYLRVLQQHDLLQIDDDSAGLKQVIPVHVSNSAQGVIQARVDRLDEPSRTTLRAAAVIGRSFPLRLLSMIHPDEPSDDALNEYLTRLSDQQLIDLELAEPERVYRFKHGLIHEVAYNSLLFGQRRLLHTNVADWYLQAHATDLRERRAPLPVYDLVIQHLARAEEWERHADTCRLAVMQVADHNDRPVALRYIVNALKARARTAPLFDLLLTRLYLNDRAGDLINQRDDLTTLAETNQPTGDPLVTAAQAYFETRLLIAEGHYDQAAIRGTETITTLQMIESEHAEKYRAWYNWLWIAGLDGLGVAHQRLQQLDEARNLHLQALEVCSMTASETAAQTPHQLPPIGNIRMLEVRCRYNLAMIELARGTNDRAIQTYEQAITLARSISDWHGESHAQIGLAEALLRSGKSLLAQRAVERALATATAIDNRIVRALALQQMARLHAEQGHFDEAVRRIWQALAICTGSHLREIEVSVLEDVERFATIHEHTANAMASSKTPRPYAAIAGD
jgi:class 3 adenylate cyclase/tetratricopeptide (TPR) repeat protein